MAITINGTNGLTTDNGALKLDTDTLVVDDTNNRVGIGTSSPATALDVAGTVTADGLTVASDSVYAIDVSRVGAGNTTLRITGGSTAGNDAVLRADIANTTGSTGVYFGDTDTSGIGRIMYEHNGDYMRFYTSSTEKMRIDSSGTLLVGTTANIGGILGAGQFKNVNAGAAGIVVGNSGGTSVTNTILFVNSNGIVGGISTSGSSTAYNTSSDYRLKENVVEITDGIDRVKLLNPSRFNFIADSDTTVDGFLAHEVQEVVPEAIAGAKDATKEEEYEVTPAVLDDDGNLVTEAVMGTRTVPDYQGIDQSKLVPLLTAALQEAITKIEALEARVTALENA